MIHRLQSVAPERSTLYGLKLVWDDGRIDTVDMSGVVYRYAVFAPLRGNPRLFHAVKRVDRGLGIAWTKDMDYAAQSLRQLADEQRPMSGEELRSFEAEHKLAAADTAAVLDISVRTVKAYRRAKKLLVAIAIRDARRARFARGSLPPFCKAHAHRLTAAITPAGPLSSGRKASAISATGKPTPSSTSTKVPVQSGSLNIGTRLPTSSHAVDVPAFQPCEKLAHTKANAPGTQTS